MVRGAGRSWYEALVVDGTRRWFDGGKGAVVVEAGFAPGGCLAFVAAGSVVADELLFPADTEWLNNVVVVDLA